LEFVAGTDIPITLEKYGYNWLDFMDETKFPLLEQDLPHLCADRLDYFLRDARDLGLAGDDEIASTLRHLRAFEGQIVTDDVDSARWLGYTFIAADKASWANFREVGLYELAARAIRRGLQIGVIDESDFWGTDLPAWEKLLGSSDQQLQYDIQRVHADTRFEWNETEPDFRVSTKLRAIDPDLLTNGKVQPLSVFDSDFAIHRSEYLAQNSGKWPMKVIGPGIIFN
jgi:HD superfamily phosphohydrolase